MKQWTQYWQKTQSLNSFAEGDNASGYQGELLAFWQQQLASLTAKASVLDIGTGNGALAVLGYQYAKARNHSWDITAIDAADIRPWQNSYSDPDITAAIQHIAFLANTFAESLPFSDNHFDLLCSQFALEYSDLSLSLPECIRVLKPAGKLVAIMHCEASSIVQDSRQGLEVLEQLSSSDVFDLVAETLMVSDRLIREGKPAKQDADFNRLNDLLLGRVTMLQRQYQGTEYDNWFHKVMAAVVPLLHRLGPDNRSIFMTYREDLALHELRLRDQLSSVIDDDRRQTINHLLSGLTVQYSWHEVNIDGQLFGWALAVTK